MGVSLKTRLHTNALCVFVKRLPVVHLKIRFVKIHSETGNGSAWFWNEREQPEPVHSHAAISRGLCHLVVAIFLLPGFGFLGFFLLSLSLFLDLVFAEKLSCPLCHGDHQELLCWLVSQPSKAEFRGARDVISRALPVAVLQ